MSQPEDPRLTHSGPTKRISAMPALTLTQPWASLVAIGAKRIETRSWNTRYRGPIAIHAAKGYPLAAKSFTCSKVVIDAFTEAVGSWSNPLYAMNADDWPVGAVVATAEVEDTFPITEDSWSYLFKFGARDEAAFGDYTYPGRFGWLLTHVEPLSEPIPAKGALGLWRWPGA